MVYRVKKQPATTIINGPTENNKEEEVEEESKEA
jgi:hypothetical protein